MNEIIELPITYFNKHVLLLFFSLCKLYFSPTKKTPYSPLRKKKYRERRKFLQYGNFSKPNGSEHFRGELCFQFFHFLSAQVDGDFAQGPGLLADYSRLFRFTVTTKYGKSRNEFFRKFLRKTVRSSFSFSVLYASPLQPFFR